MIKKYTISNFKAFSSSATLPIKPITLIYGQNSAGKSSILQSLLLMKQSNFPLDYRKVMKKFETKECGDIPLNINGGIKDFKSFDRIIHNNEIEKNLSAKIMFDSKVLDNHYLKFKMPLKAKQLIKALNKECDIIGLQHTYKQDQDSKEVESYQLSMYINEDVIFNVMEDKITINREHIFWPIYWNKFGKDIALKNFTVLLEYLKRRDDGFDGYSQMSADEINNLFQLKTKIIKDDKEIDSELISFFEHFFSKAACFSNFSPSFDAREFELFDYSLSNCLDIENDQYHKLLNIFSGINYNQQNDYFSDNIFLVCMILSELISDYFDKIVYIGPIRSLPEKFEFVDGNVVEDQYVGQDGSRIARILFDNRLLLHEINEAFSNIGIDYHIEFIFDSRNNESKNSVYNLNIRRNFSNISSSISDVGFGISQIIPVIVQCIISKGSTIIIEQPELHLHPRLQAELGDLFIDSAINKNNTLLIETHSEHILLRIMRRIRETTNETLPEGATPIRAEDVSLVYVESIETDGDKHSIIREMPLNDQGELVKAWPGGFFEEGLREVF